MPDYQEELEKINKFWDKIETEIEDEELKNVAKSGRAYTLSIAARMWEGGLKEGREWFDQREK